MIRIGWRGCEGGDASVDQTVDMPQTQISWVLFDAAQIAPEACLLDRNVIHVLDGVSRPKLIFGHGTREIADLVTATNGLPGARCGQSGGSSETLF
ncbi:FAD-binding monooxygenase [Agrobacterium tumefaciens 5A]|nr:FAD-binding monooxygenase [Agrobacterium tumefaciens 5A]